MKLLNIFHAICSRLLFFVCSFLRNLFAASKKSKEKTCETLKSIEGRLQLLLSYDTLSDKVTEITSVLYDLKKFLKHHPKLEYRYRDVLDHEFSHFSKKEIPYIDGITGEIKFISFDDAKANKAVAVFYDGKGDSVFELPSNCLDLNEKQVVLGNLAIGQVYINGAEAFCHMYAIEHSLRSTVNRWYHESHLLFKQFERM